jgi:phospholipid/cholesterol/gamma-HCH transport system permease protein
MSEAKAAKSPSKGSIRAALAGGFSPVVGFIRVVGEHVILFGQAVFWGFRRPFRLRLYIGAFTGAVTALQAVNAFRLLKAEGFSGSAVGLSLAVELAPVLTGLMLAGRVGAGIATELGTMRITEQMDALESMAVSPVQYLVVPRIAAGTVMAPILTMVFFAIGMVGAYFVAVVTLGVDRGQFIENFKWYVDPVDITQGLLKSLVFGAAIALIGCYQGFHATGGGRGVGLATTRAVVVGSVSILVLDYFLSDVLLRVLPKR